MVSHEMNIQRFRKLVEAYGTHSERWPEDDRQAALIFLETDLDAIKIISDFKSLDDALNADVVT